MRVERGHWVTINNRHIGVDGHTGLDSGERTPTMPEYAEKRGVRNAKWFVDHKNNVVFHHATRYHSYIAGLLRRSGHLPVPPTGIESDVQYSGIIEHGKAISTGGDEPPTDVLRRIQRLWNERRDPDKTTVK